MGVPRAQEYYSIGTISNFFENSRRYSRRYLRMNDAGVEAVHRCQRRRWTIIDTTPVIGVCAGCLWTLFFMAVQVKLSADVSDLGGRRYRRFWFEIFWPATGASYQDVWGVYGCAFLRWHHRRPRPTQAAKDVAVFSRWHPCSCHTVHSFAERTGLCRHNSSCIPQNFSLLSPVSLTPLINIRSRISPRIFEKIWYGPNGILRGPGNTDSWRKTWCWKFRVRLPLTYFSSWGLYALKSIKIRKNVKSVLSMFMIKREGCVGEGRIGLGTSLKMHNPE